MQAALAKRIEELVENGWEPHATTETTATLFGRRPFRKAFLEEQKQIKERGFLAFMWPKLVVFLVLLVLWVLFLQWYF